MTIREQQGEQETVTVEGAREHIEGAAAGGFLAQGIGTIVGEKDHAGAGTGGAQAAKNLEPGAGVEIQIAKDDGREAAEAIGSVGVGRGIEQNPGRFAEQAAEAIAIVRASGEQSDGDGKFGRGMAAPGHGLV